MDILKKLELKAKRLGATEFGLSKTKLKRFYVIYNNKIINFGSKVGKTFIDHKDKIKRANWRARHSMIMKNGKPAYKQKSSASWWAYRLLW